MEPNIHTGWTMLLYFIAMISLILVALGAYESWVSRQDYTYEVVSGKHKGRWGKIFSFYLVASMNVEQTEEEYVAECEQAITRNCGWKKAGMEGFVPKSGTDVYHQYKWSRHIIFVWRWQIRKLSHEEQEKREAEWKERHHQWFQETYS